MLDQRTPTAVLQFALTPNTEKDLGGVYDEILLSVFSCAVNLWGGHSAGDLPYLGLPGAGVAFVEQSTGDVYMACSYRLAIPCRFVKAVTLFSVGSPTLMGVAYKYEKAAGS